ncbi:transglutaminase-like cysteine peptidase [Pseudogulbenkiania sp. MAI-1]|uniref:transglutaminase-like cysteine peptidase n=1 Tax=Pseudogulbenkiania sp. MAI-1 TaxID=990370 RepID=UPI00045E5C14|nr:transglutaminase-like cysteine peptidase [Pseudogulbenkiania sp. MAI-1]
MAQRSSRHRLIRQKTPLLWRARPTVLVWLIVSLLSACATTKSGVALDFARQSQAIQRFGSRGIQNYEAWRSLISVLGNRTENAKLIEVNTFFNRRIQFTDDTAVWHQDDYWATPIETLGRGAGDCEDFVIAKYKTLTLLDVPAAKLRLTYVRALLGGPNSAVSQAHMVLAYYPGADAEPLVLDNLITDIKPASQRTDLIPVFSFNNDGVWMPGNPSRPAGNVERLTRWMSLQERMRAEGF